MSNGNVTTAILRTPLEPPRENRLDCPVTKARRISSPAPNVSQGFPVKLRSRCVPNDLKPESTALALQGYVTDAFARLCWSL
jgi:hypothetical protein